MIKILVLSILISMKSLNQNHYALLKEAIIDSLPVSTAYFPLGIVWGILWEQAGLSPLWGIALSASVYAGAVQFIGLSLLVSGASVWGLVAATTPIAIRNSFYIITALNRLPPAWLSRLYAAFGLVDATFAIIVSKPEEKAHDPWYHIPLTITIQLYWILGTAAGVYSAGYIPDGIASLDFALPALIAVLAWEQWRKIASWKPVKTSLIAAGVSWLLLGHSWFILALVICTVIAIAYPIEETPS